MGHPDENYCNHQQHKIYGIGIKVDVWDLFIGIHPEGYGLPCCPYDGPARQIPENIILGLMPEQKLFIVGLKPVVRVFEFLTLTLPAVQPQVQSACYKDQ